MQAHAKFDSHCLKILLLGLAFGCSGAPQQTTAAPTAVTEPESTAAKGDPAGESAKQEPAAKPAAISKSSYGRVDDQEVLLFTLVNAKGAVLKVTNYGAIVTELHVPDRNGKLGDVVLGFDNLEGYRKKSPYFGAIVGRVANRIANHRFELEGKRYELAANNPPHHLHGGVKGWDKVVWQATARETPEGPALELSYVSADGEEGYPGTVKVRATYTLSNDNSLRVEMAATSDKTTIVNMVHHSYWNLGGQGSGSIADHELTIFADKYTPGDPLPDGKLKAVKGTPFDFSVAKPIGKDLSAAGGKPVGFNHNWVVSGEPAKLRPVARLKDPKSGRVMTLEADQPGVQFYSGNYLDGVQGKGASYAQYSGLCLETQKFPNAINVPAWRGEVTLKPGQTYQHTMIHRFSAE